MKPAPKDGILDMPAYVGGRDAVDGVANPHKMSANENPLGASPQALATLGAAFDPSIYPDGHATHLRAKLAELNGLKAESSQHPDEADRAAAESEKTLELRTRDRHRKLINKIDSALRRIEDKTYGYCEDTGEPISLKRLEARPIATLGLEAQERHEKRERVYRDD